MEPARYDALLLASFGGPEGPEQVLPFLEHVTAGRGIPRERLAEVGAHYYRFGGVSPINRQCRDLKQAIEADFAAAGLELPVYWGNRHAPPFFADALTGMAAVGVRSALVLLTSAYPSYSGCRAYREDLAAGLAEGPGAERIELTRLPHYSDRPGFVEPFVDATVRAIAELPEPARHGAPLVFTTHSIPVAMAVASGRTGGEYVAAHRQVAQRVATAVATRTGYGADRPYELVYQSRSGPPGQPWLEPDVCDHLDRLKAAGAPGAVLVPIGFVCDHMEVLFDLDVEAADRAAKLGLPLVRAATPGTDPRFVAMIRELVVDQLTGRATPARCPHHCCPNPRGARPVIGEEDA